jgi:predicted nuclease with TOPRIM domain
VFLWGDKVVVVTHVSTEELEGAKLTSYNQALKAAEALYERNEKTHFPLYNAVGRIKDCLKEGKPFDEAIRELEGEVTDNEQKYNQLLQKFTNSNEFELV